VVGANGDGMNLATVWEAVAATVPEAPALIHGDTTTTWSAFEDRAARIATHLEATGLREGSKVAVYLDNRPEYLEATFAAFKLRAATANVNYRYLGSELAHVLDDSDAEAVVFAARFADRLDEVRAGLPRLRTFLCVGADEWHPLPWWALDYESVIADHDAMAPIDRSGDDLWLLYTGGTTGLPKGVMWPHRSMLGASAATFAAIKSPVPLDVQEVIDAVRTFHERSKAIRLLPAAPLMHGTAALTSMAVLAAGGTVVTLTADSFDADELCATVDRHRVSQLTIVGDAFARPMIEALERAAAAGEPYDMSSVKVILSSGVMWSRATKEALHRWCGAALADALGSSEGIGFASSVARPGSATATATFSLGEHARVIDEQGVDVVPGSGQRGLLAVGGPIPIGYYKDPVKTASTFREIDGRIWSVPGDFATVEADGTVRLLGRGSGCINTAGEKVYPEEVEEVLKLHPAVTDANVVGVADEKWGQSVVAVVSIDRSGPGGADLPDEAALISHSKAHLAGYKCPKRVVLVDTVRRGPNGKADYRWAAAAAAP
jgi:acyl-CoA synthetase (AMP-forming)/AMP-acid ligase II